MPRDYAHRPRRTRNAPTTRTRFHWSSFAIGLALGIVTTVAGAMLPELLAGGSTAGTAESATTDDALVAAETAAAAPTKPESETRYEFYERLPRVHVETDTAAYGGPIEPTATAAAAQGAQTRTSPTEYVLQAGSFRNLEDADRLRGMLAALGLDASTSTVTLAGGATRHRVLVGPFDSEPAVHRALTQLREKDIDALLMARKTAG